MNNSNNDNFIVVAVVDSALDTFNVTPLAAAIQKRAS